MVDYTAARTAMVDGQVRPADVTRYAVIDAMLGVPRERFVPRGQRALAYTDIQLPLAPRRIMLDPRTLGKMLDALEIRPGELVLDVGSGLGYAAVVMSRMAGTVVALESDDELARQLGEALAEAEADNVLMQRGPLTEGHADSAPFDVIVIEGGVETVPQALFDQLAEGGRLAAIVMEGEVGVCRIWHRVAGQVSSWPAFNATAPVLPGFDAERSFTF
jgi:protein-L-isoaspartate(D-aspartate) O-methyltransferase